MIVLHDVKYSPPDSTVRLIARRDAEGLVIQVQDQGGGIGEEHLPRIFERFYRVDRARSRELGGTGLGLAIVKHIAQAHGGRADVESTVGEGSIFSIRLPAPATKKPANAPHAFERQHTPNNAEQEQGGSSNAPGPL